MVGMHVCEEVDELLHRVTSSIRELIHDNVGEANEHHV